MNPEAFMWISVGIGSLGISAILTAFLLGPIGRAIGDRIRGRGQDLQPGQWTGRFDRLETLVEGRMADMEERMTFAERLLVGHADDVEEGR